MKKLRKFYIGDPCYVMDDELYDQWGKKYDYNDGKLKIIVDGQEIDFIVHSTYYGDGCYLFSTNSSTYRLRKTICVDAGCIAIVPEELWAKNRPLKEAISYGIVVSTENDKLPRLEYVNGTFIISMKPVNTENKEIEFESDVIYDASYVEILTNDSEDDEEDDYEDEEDEEEYEDEIDEDEEESEKE